MLATGQHAALVAGLLPWLAKPLLAKADPPVVNLTRLDSFDDPVTGAPTPRGHLLAASDGVLYGTTFSGGAYLNGSVFRLNKDGSGFTVLKTFNTPTDGAYLQSGVTEGSDGALYGTATPGDASAAYEPDKILKDSLEVVRFPS
jgi:uncharacterized repeat protein (TIGR03803 family)